MGTASLRGPTPCNRRVNAQAGNQMEINWSDFNINPAENPVLAHLPEAALRLLLAKAERVTKPASSFLMREGETSDAIYFLMSGEVSILKSGVEIDRQGSGGVLGEMGVLTTQPRTASVQCRTKVSALRVKAESFLAVVNTHLDSLRSLVRELVGKVQGSQGVRVRQEARIHAVMDTLSRMVSPDVVSRVLQRHTPEELLEGQASEAAVLFLKLKDFAAQTETLPPRELLRTLNEHLSVVTQAIERYGGTVVTFMGDALLATFNYPMTLERPVSAALACCLDCQRDMTAFHRRQQANGHLCLEWSAGLSFGTVVGGAVGSEMRFNFTVLGEAVNLAVRLEQLARRYPAKVLFAEACVDRLTKESAPKPAKPRGKEARSARGSGSASMGLDLGSSSNLAGKCIQIDRVQVEGRAEPIGIYATLDISGDLRATFNTAFGLYLDGKFAEAAGHCYRSGGALPAFLAARCGQLAARRNFKWPGYFVWDVASIRG